MATHYRGVFCSWPGCPNPAGPVNIPAGGQSFGMSFAVALHGRIKMNVFKWAGGDLWLRVFNASGGIPDNIGNVSAGLATGWLTTAVNSARVPPNAEHIAVYYAHNGTNGVPWRSDHGGVFSGTISNWPIWAWAGRYSDVGFGYGSAQFPPHGSQSWYGVDIELTVSPPEWNTPSQRSGKMGTYFGQDFGAWPMNSFWSPYSYNITAGALPPGLSMNMSTAGVTGTPTGPVGVYDFYLTATNADGGPVGRWCRILIGPLGSTENLAMTGAVRL